MNEDNLDKFIGYLGDEGVTKILMIQDSMNLFERELYDTVKNYLDKLQNLMDETEQLQPSVKVGMLFDYGNRLKETVATINGDVLQQRVVDMQKQINKLKGSD